MIGIDHIEVPEVGADEREQLIRACTKLTERKRKAQDRWLIYTEAHAPLIYRRLCATLNDEAYRDEVVKHIDLSDNAALDAIHDTCTVWSQGPRRSVAGATKAEASAFNALVVESLIDVHGQEWNETAEFVGPILVVPAIRKKKLRFDVLLPTYTEVFADPEDPFGTPLAAAWPIHGTKSETPGVGHFMYLDGQGWSRWSVDHGKVSMVGEVTEHGLGRFPGVPLRFDTPHSCDYYGHPSRNQRFEDATIAVGAIRSVLAFTRKAQNGKLLAAIGFLGDAVKQQPLDPETGIAINIKPGQNGVQPTATVQTLDFDTPPKNSIEHANDYRRSVASAYGGTIAADGRMVFDTEALTEQRRRQIPRARAFCLDLWVNAVGLCRTMHHPLAPDLPDEEKVRAGFSVDFGTMSRKFADPKQEADHTDWLRSNGAIDQLDVMRKQGNENLDDEQLKAKVQEKLDTQAWFNDQVTKRNLSMVAGGAATAPQAFGALGPVIRDAPDNQAPEGVDKKPEGTTNGERSDEPG